MSVAPRFVQKKEIVAELRNRPFRFNTTIELKTITTSNNKIQLKSKFKVLHTVHFVFIKVKVKAEVAQRDPVD